jgi:ubiquitin carboxyl-terminal hydrolase 31
MIGLWSAPQVLVVHLKRFRQTTKGRHAVTKLSSIVDFPTDGLDLCPHISKRSRGGQDVGGVSTTPTNGSFTSSQASSPMNGCFGLGSWKHRASFKKHLTSTVSNGRMNNMNGFHNGFSFEDGNSGVLYDLFAVCNHHGKDLQGGHYTAYCKNPVDNSWWSFDDTRVVQLASAAEVKTASAYILFYQRRPAGLNGTTASSPIPIPNHWCRPLIKKHHKVPPVARLPPTVNSNTNNNNSSNSATNGEVERETYAAEAQRVLSQVDAIETNGYHHLDEAENAENDYRGHVRNTPLPATAPLAQIEESTTVYDIHPDIQIESTV